MRGIHDPVLVERADRTIARDFAYFASTILFGVLGLRFFVLTNLGV